MQKVLCNKPWTNPKTNQKVDCGSCLPCRINKRNIWTTRLLLELSLHDKSVWITLTYNDENLPFREELNQRDYQLWLKRLRKDLEPKKIRFYICGEYGDVSGRPHYHCVLFGVAVPFVGLAELARIDQLNFYPKEVVQHLRHWNKGNIYFSDPTPELMAYSCSHITKDLRVKDKIEAGRKPAFHSMSPALGKGAMRAIVSWLSTDEGVRSYFKRGDVPTSVRIDGKIRPIGKFLQNYIRSELGLEEKITEEMKFKLHLKQLHEILERGYDWKDARREHDLNKAKQIYSIQKQSRSL